MLQFIGHTSRRYELQALVAAFGDISRFKSGDAAASYLGLTPSTRQSDTSVYHGPITKQGNSTARYMLVQAAQQYSRQPGPLGHFFQRIKRRKNHNVAVVATARKLAVIAWRLLTTGEPYRYAQPRNTTDKLAELRVAATGESVAGAPPKASSRKQFFREAVAPFVHSMRSTRTKVCPPDRLFRTAHRTTHLCDRQKLPDVPTGARTTARFWRNEFETLLDGEIPDVNHSGQERFRTDR